VVGKSTVPVGTAERLQATLHELAGPAVNHSQGARRSSLDADAV
jgi:hypothetical protein